MAKGWKYKNDIPERKIVIIYQEYWEFVDWIAMPTPLRKPKTQREFAKEKGIHETTISKWKMVEGFRDDVKKRIKETAKDDLSNVITALKNKIFKDGSAAEVKLFLEWADDWAEESKVTHGGEIELKGESAEARKKLVEEYEKKLKELKTK